MTINMKINTLYDFSHKDVKYILDDGMGKPITVSMIELLEPSYGVNAQTVVNEMLTNELKHESEVDDLQSQLDMSLFERGY